MRNLLALLVGALVSFLVLLLFTGENALTILALLVVCTGGLGLIPILMVSYGVGMCIFTVLKNFRKGPTNPAEQGATAVAADYIRRARSEGRDDGWILGALARAGWPEPLIQDAMRLVGHEGR